MRGPIAVRHLLWTLLALLVAPLGLPAAAADLAPPGVITARPGPVIAGDDAPRGFRPLVQKGMARRGVLYVPTGYDPQRPAPLVVLLHGAGGDPRRAVDGIKRQAEARGTIVLAPASRGLTWDLIAERRFGEDARMLDALLRELFARYAVDPARVAIAGFSDGGSYALSLGLSNGDLFRRVVAFSPGFVLPFRQVGRPPLLISHGTSDTVLPIDATGRPVAATLQRAGYDVRFVEFDGGHLVPPGIAAEAFELAARPADPTAGAPRPIRLAEAASEEGPRLEDLLWPGERRQVARWLDPVCIRFVSTASTLADQLGAEFRGVAVEAGAPLAGRPCRANVTVQLVRQPTGPAITWDYSVRDAARGLPRALQSVVVRLDKDRAEAAAPDAVGALLALVALAEVELSAPPQRETLLALFDDPAAPQRLTTRDLDFLRRLYAVPKDGGRRAPAP
jgi:phospholipase/carboxylesterase